MPSPFTNAADSPPDPVLPDGLAEAGVYGSEQEAFEHGLAVLALGIPYWLTPYKGGFGLFVEAPWLAQSRNQLTLYNRESRRWPPARSLPPIAKSPTSVLVPLLWVLTTIGVFRAQEFWPDELENLGVLDAQAVFARHEYWRIGTSLFLHADIAHLTANLISGFFVFSAVVTNQGPRRGLALLALASLAGNALVVSLGSSSEYRSLGASTAIFGGLGVLTGAALRNAIAQEGLRHWRPLFVPVAAGLTLLGLFGAGQAQTDVAAHACGFGVGFVCGLLGSKSRPNTGE